MKFDYTHYYQRYHPDTPEHRRAMVQYCNRVLAPFLPVSKDAHVLDIGSGGGFALLALREAGFQNIEGVESDEGQANRCRKLDLHVRKIDDTIAFLESVKSDYSLVLLFDVLEHFPREQQLLMLQAIHAALKPGGRLVCTVPNANSTLAARWRYNDWTHHTSYTEISLDFLLHHAGFEQPEISAIEFNVRPTLWWIPFAGGARHWWAFRLVRFFRRIVAMAELGPEQGRSIPLSLNLLGTGVKA